MNRTKHLDCCEILASLNRLPGHNPERFETSDGFDDPTRTNGDRASEAAKALESFQKCCNPDGDIHTDSVDLICGLLHLVHANGCEPLEVLHEAIQHFAYEAGELPSSMTAA